MEKNLTKNICICIRTHTDTHTWGFPGGSVGKEFTCNAGEPGLISGLGRSHEKEMATHSSILAWKISWTEGLCGLQSLGLQRVGHDWVTNTFLLNTIFIPVPQPGKQTLTIRQLFMDHLPCSRYCGYSFIHSSKFWQILIECLVCGQHYPDTRDRTLHDMI